jgi:uncharacterized protein YerC
MPQISKYPLDKQIEVRVKELLDDGLASLNSRDDIERFLIDLLTPTEKIMLSKRVAIAMLLANNYDYRQISKILKVSTSTIRTVVNWNRVRGSGYKKVINNLLSQKKWTDILNYVSMN